MGKSQLVGNSYSFVENTHIPFGSVELQGHNQCSRQSSLRLQSLCYLHAREQNQHACHSQQCLRLPCASSPPLAAHG